MRSSTGRWVSGDDFFDREQELKALETRIRDLNHTLLTGQRRMGKTSLARELGRRLEAQGWGFLPVNVEGAISPEDVVARMAEAVHPIRPIARLRDFAKMQRRDRLSISDVDEVYRKELLGPSGSNDLAHYDTRLRDGLEKETHRIAVEILAEAATQEVFTAAARRNLELRHSTLVDDAPDRIADALDVLMHDGHLKACDDGYRFLSRLLKDWWAARYRDHHADLAPLLSTERRTPR